MQVEIKDGEAEWRANALKTVLNVDSPAEVIRLALRVIDYCVFGQEAQGNVEVSSNKIEFTQPDGEETITLLEWPVNPSGEVNAREAKEEASEVSKEEVSRGEASKDKTDPRD